MTEASKEDNDVAVARVLYIHYPLHFWKNINKVWALLDFGNEINVMTPTYLSKLGLRVYRINVGAQKIDSSTFETLRIVLANF